MRVLLFGASGMVGQGAIMAALEDPVVTEVVSVVRRPTGRSHAKLVEVVHQDLFDLAPIANKLSGFDACFDCVGVSSVGLDEKEYTRQTYDLTMSIARAVHARSPQAVFTYVTGVGTDSTEKGRSMWARVKGRTENAVLALGFRAAYMFRPGFIQPERGIESGTGWYRAFYVVARPLGGILVKTMPGSATSTSAVGDAMRRTAACRAHPRGARHQRAGGGPARAT